MKITIFTSNQPRHLALISKMKEVSSEVFAIIECTTLFPGFISDFYQKTPVMQQYFQNVIRAERACFGEPQFIGGSSKTLSIKSGDLNHLSYSQLAPALNSDVYIVFGATYIKGWLVNCLIERKAINIHMGLSPYYRGSSCNFWALYDLNFGYVGSTIHMLTKGLDSGPILYHALPLHCEGDDAFDFSMRAVKSAFDSVAARIVDRSIFELIPDRQKKLQEIRYTKNNDFTDDVAKSFLLKSGEMGFGTKEFKITEYPPLVEPYFSGK